MIAVEEAQTHVRAENGIKEKVIGYLGSEEEVLDTLEFDSRLVPKTQAKDLPENVKWLYYAEIHRLRTGETMTGKAYKEKFGEPSGC